LFSQNDRAFSHGCIRINKALELAEYLIRDSRGWDTAHLQMAIAEGKTQIILLKNPIPVHILYLTAWAYDEGAAYFAKDVYDCDQGLINALEQVPLEQVKLSKKSSYIFDPGSKLSDNSLKKRDIP
jgi:murein L,D-transpeptidase YcbB/YkuD